jgi:hypothetical protein
MAHLAPAPAAVTSRRVTGTDCGDITAVVMLFFQVTLEADVLAW